MGGELAPVRAWQRELRRSALDPTARLVGLVLSTYMDGAGRAQVSRSVIAEGCGLADVSSVKRAVCRLERAGLLGVDRAGHQQHVPSRYQACSRGGAVASPNGSRGGWCAPADGSQGGLRSDPGGALEPRKYLRSSEGQDRSARGGSSAPPEGQDRSDGEDHQRGDQQRPTEAELERAAQVRALFAEQDRRTGTADG